MELQVIQNKIFEIRGYRVMLDFHLAEMYEVRTKVLKQAVKRNIQRFPCTRWNYSPEFCSIRRIAGK